MGRYGHYLFKRPGSQNWWIRLQFSGKLKEIEGRSKVEFSLGTPNRQEAEILALEHIGLHKAKLLLLQSNKIVKFDQGIAGKAYDNGLHPLKEGGFVFADDTVLTYFDESGKLVKRGSANRVNKFALAENLKVDRRLADWINQDAKPSNSEFLDVWIKLRSIKPHIEA